jgi:hypothetical protein
MNLFQKLRCLFLILFTISLSVVDAKTNHLATYGQNILKTEGFSPSVNRGVHTIALDTSSLSTGIYYYMIEANNRRIIYQLSLAK